MPKAPAPVPVGVSHTRLLLSLQWRLWKRTLAGNPAIKITAALAGFYALLGLLGGAVLAVQGLGNGPTPLFSAVIGGGVVGYLLLALFLPSGEGQLRPASFSSLAITARELLPATAIATLLQTRGVIAAVCTLVTMVVATVAVVVAGPAWLILVIVPMLLISLVTALMLGEFIAIMIGSGGRVSRERTGVIGILLFLVVVVGYNFLATSGIGLAEISLVGSILAWTPLGAAGGVVAAAAASQWLVALAQLIIALVTIVAFTWWWRVGLDRGLRAPLDSGRSSGRERKASRRGLLLPGVPYTPGGVIFARAFRYLRRDSRLLPSVLMIPLLGVIFLVQGILGESELIYFGLLLMALLAGSLAANDFGYDGPASWLHLVTGVNARTQLLARHAASAAPMVIMISGYAVVVVILAPDTGFAVLAGIAALGVLCTSLGIGLFLTTFNPYPTAPPGTNPWSDKSGFSGAAFIAAFATMLLGWIPSAPGIVLLIIGYGGGSPGVLVTGILLALVVPGILYVTAMVVCTRYITGRRVRIHDKVRNWVK